MTLKVVKPDEHKEWCREQIKKDGLYNAVKAQLDEIILILSQGSYGDFSEGTEYAQNILDLIETFGEKYGIYRVGEYVNVDGLNSIESRRKATFKENILELMRDHGLTQRDVAKKIGVTEVRMSRFLNGDRAPNPMEIKNLCLLFGCTEDRLFEKD